MRAHQKKTALLIIDMINEVDFPEAESLLRHAVPAAKAIAKLKARLKKRKVPVLYVNNNFGRWRSDWRELYKRCSAPEARGRELARLLPPDEDDFFLLKPKHSGFYASPLEILLEELGVKRLIITGVATNICVFFTVHDAHARGYEVIVPRDCVAANDAASTHAALEQIKLVFSIKPVESGSIRI